MAGEPVLIIATAIQFELHMKYGPIVRYGPDKLSITHESAIPVIYQKSARAYAQDGVFDAYGAAHPNVFRMRYEAVCCQGL